MKDRLEKTLLIVDDEIDITKSLYRQFRRKYIVYTATNGDDALKIIKEKHIQVILSDQRMPGMTGVDLLDKIKDQYPEVVKIILTGYSDIEAVFGAINKGQVFRYLTKPWNPLELEMAVQEAFEKQELISKNNELLRRLKDTNLHLEEKINERTEELVCANEKLKQLNIEKNKYIGIVAHDLRNPIGNAYNFSALLISGFNRFPEHKKMKYLGVINDRCGYSLKLIEDFLDTSKIEAGILDLNFKEYDFEQIITACIEQNQIFAKEKMQQIFFEITANNHNILCDKDKIEQVINNLISNAIKYSERGTKIWITTNNESDTLRVSIKDQGRGIPKDEIDILFNDYQTTSTKSTADEKSTGLGLAIVKKIVESHNGTLSVKSELGKGSIFSFTIPF